MHRCEATPMRRSRATATLGGMTPDERQEQGPRIHALREAVTAAMH